MIVEGWALLVYNSYRFWPDKWVTGVITLLIGVITPHITSHGGPPYVHHTFTWPMLQGFCLMLWCFASWSPGTPGFGGDRFAYNNSSFHPGKLAWQWNIPTSWRCSISYIENGESPTCHVSFRGEHPPPKSNIDTKHDGPWNMYLRLQTWLFLGYLLRFQRRYQPLRGELHPPRKPAKNQAVGIPSPKNVSRHPGDDCDPGWGSISIHI